MQLVERKITAFCLKKIKKFPHLQNAPESTAVPTKRLSPDLTLSFTNRSLHLPPIPMNYTEHFFAYFAEIASMNNSNKKRRLK